MQLIMPLMYEVRHSEYMTYRVHIIPTSCVVVVDDTCTTHPDFNAKTRTQYFPKVKMMFDVKVFQNGVFKMESKLWLTYEEYATLSGSFVKHVADLMSTIFGETIDVSEITKIKWCDA